MSSTTRNRPAAPVRSALIALIALAALSGRPAVAGETAANASPAAAAFDSLKALAGHWEGAGPGGTRVAMDYEVIGNGSALVERFTFLDGDHRGATMVTVYHQDGDDLVLTHYCMAGNQPTMRATRIEDDEIGFELTGITNLAGPDAGHMHRASFELHDADHLTTAWTFREGGEDRFTEVIDAERVARSR